LRWAKFVSPKCQLERVVGVVGHDLMGREGDNAPWLAARREDLRSDSGDLTNYPGFLMRKKSLSFSLLARRIWLD